MKMFPEKCLNNKFSLTQTASIIVLSLFFNECRKPAPKAPVEDFILDKGRIVIPPDSPLKGRLKIGKVEYKDFVKEVTAPASIEADPTKMVKVTPPLVGRIVKIYVSLGSKVEPGQILFSIDSPDLALAQKEYLSAKAEMLQAEKNLNRQIDLLANGVGTQKEVELARTNFEVTKSQMKQTVTRLKMHSIDPEKTVLGEPLKVYSPIKGRVVSLNAAAGEYHNDPNQTLIIVADLSTVWITANVREKDIRFISQEEYVLARISAYPETRFEGKVLFVDDLLDLDTRTVKVRVEFSNSDKKLKPGMYATVIFKDKSQKAILIPSKAIIQENDKKFVFVRQDDGSFEKREVNTDDSDSVDEDIVITDGLKEGDFIIMEGSFYLLKVK
ncbi:MAG TPA: efflux RND transporter periplasmic adaptor subunit [Leptospiraceae bacterium]|nr:efflux RND transporter periplasmic adaptor subunit [Leptospiraceae bacterium]